MLTTAVLLTVLTRGQEMATAGAGYVSANLSRSKVLRELVGDARVLPIEKLTAAGFSTTEEPGGRAVIVDLQCPSLSLELAKSSVVGRLLAHGLQEPVLVERGRPDSFVLAGIGSYCFGLTDQAKLAGETYTLSLSVDVTVEGRQSKTLTVGLLSPDKEAKSTKPVTRLRQLIGEGQIMEPHQVVVGAFTDDDSDVASRGKAALVRLDEMSQQAKQRRRDATGKLDAAIRKRLFDAEGKPTGEWAAVVNKLQEDDARRLGFDTVQELRSCLMDPTKARMTIEAKLSIYVVGASPSETMWIGVSLSTWSLGGLTPP